MINECLDFLNIKEGSIVIDCTFGAGGHSQKILEIIGDKGKLFAFEKDEKSYLAGLEKFKDYKNFKLFNSSYTEMDVYLKDFCEKIDAILFDLGVSSMQLDDAERGFSFKNDGPLDMRFSKKQDTKASDVVNNYSYNDLKNIFSKYGEEKFSGRIADMICYYRENTKLIETTKELADLVEKKIHSTDKKHPATRIFQALRIEVNDELKTVEYGVKKAVELLKKNGRIVVMSFHSLEDRIVKNIFKEFASSCDCPSFVPVCNCNKIKKLNILTKKPTYPTEDEIRTNKRSRSAILRVAEKI
jgi:16S rRNA (cytosine1402-N4)-methyltransferase